MHLISDGFGVYTIQITDVSSVLQTHDREEGTQLRSTGPMSARPCWIDGPQQQDSSDDRAAMARGVLGIINTVYTVVGVLNFHLIVKDVIRLKTGLNSLGHRRSNRFGAAYI